MQVIKFALGFLLLILAVFLTACWAVVCALGGLAWSYALAYWVLTLFVFDLGLELRFTKGMAPWWRNMPATDKQKETANELGIKYPQSISRREMSGLILRVKYRGHGHSCVSENARLCKVYSAANPQEAHFVKAELKKSGIDALIMGDYEEKAVGDLPAVAIAPEIWVCTEKSDVAQDLIANQLNKLGRTKAVASKWECTECGEFNEPAFELCWNCFAARAS